PALRPQRAQPHQRPGAHRLLRVLGRDARRAGRGCARGPRGLTPAQQRQGQGRQGQHRGDEQGLREGGTGGDRPDEHRPQPGPGIEADVPHRARGPVVTAGDRGEREDEGEVLQAPVGDADAEHADEQHGHRGRSLPAEGEGDEHEAQDGEEDERPEEAPRPESVVPGTHPPPAHRRGTGEDEQRRGRQPRNAGQVAGEGDERASGEGHAEQEEHRGDERAVHLRTGVGHRGVVGLDDDGAPRDPGGDAAEDGQRPEGEDHPEADELDQPRAGRHEEDLRHGDPQPVDPDRRPLPPGGDEVRDRRAPGDREDAEAQPPDRGEREGQRQGVGGEVRQGGEPEEQQPGRHDRAPAPGPQQGGDEGLGEDGEEHEDAVDRADPDRCGAPFGGPEGSDRHEGGEAREPEEGHRQERRHPGEAPHGRGGSGHHRIVTESISTLYAGPGAPIVVRVRRRGTTRMSFVPTALRGGAMIAALTLTTACLPSADGGGDEETTEQTAKGGQQLTEEEVSAALPTEGEQVPGELTLVESEDSEQDPEATAYPATCLDVELGGEEGQALDEHEAAQDKATYTGPQNGIITVTVTSYDAPVPDALFDDAGAAQSSCAEYTKIDERARTKWKLEPTTLPPMGERTYSASVEMLSSTDPADRKDFVGGTVHLAAVSTGHNLVYIVLAAGNKSNL